MHYTAYALILSVSLASRSSCECLKTKRSAKGNVHGPMVAQNWPRPLFTSPQFVFHSRFPGSFNQVALNGNQWKYSLLVLHCCNSLGMRSFHRQLGVAAVSWLLMSILREAHLQFFESLLFVSCNTWLVNVAKVRVGMNVRVSGDVHQRLLSWQQTSACRREWVRSKTRKTFISHFSKSAWALDRASFESIDSSATAASAALTAASCFWNVRVNSQPTILEAQPNLELLADLLLARSDSFDCIERRICAIRFENWRLGAAYSLKQSKQSSFELTFLNCEARWLDSLFQKSVFGNDIWVRINKVANYAQAEEVITSWKRKYYVLCNRQHWGQILDLWSNWVMHKSRFEERTWLMAGSDGFRFLFVCKS